MASYELDLHGMTWRKSLEEFIALYNHSIGCTDDPTSVQIKMIHGYGSSGEGGVIGNRLRSFCQRFETYLEFTPGEQIDGNMGCTVVTPIKRLPETDDLLAEQIWEYCEQPRPRSKIVGKFRRYGNPRIGEAIKSLEKQRRLTTLRKSGLTMYQAL